MCIRDIKEKVRRLKYCFDTNNPIDLIKELGIISYILDDDELKYHIDNDDDYYNEETINGCYFETDGLKFIFINSKLNEQERKITYAHELGHSILHPDLNTLYFFKYTNSKVFRYENEADIFSAELLLDDDIFEKYKDVSIYEIAMYENVSTDLVELKYKNLDK